MIIILTMERVFMPIITCEYLILVFQFYIFFAVDIQLGDLKLLSHIGKTMSTQSHRLKGQGT